jgi:TfoX/Sxy family transcriptional regulator of competence genes
MPAATAVEQGFARIVKRMAAEDGVALGSGRRGFGSDALTVDGRIFAMVTRGRLVLKLPSRRVSALIERGVGLPFDAGKGKPMKEWVAFESVNDAEWLALAKEARRFVGGRG